MEKVSLKKLNSFHIDAFANECHIIQHEKDLLHFAHLHFSNFHILGCGSNILILNDISKVILKNEIKGIKILSENENTVDVVVGGGECWHDFVLWTLDRNLGGLENLSLIPGTVGAAPVQNIGAYGVELKEYVKEVHGYHFQKSKTETLTAADCKFGYRESIFKHELKDQFFITDVTFTFPKKHELKLEYGNIKEELAIRNISSPTIKDVSQIVIDIRKKKLPDPSILGNAGSFFKNTTITINEFNLLKAKFSEIPFYPIDEQHVKIPTAWMIDQAGWKGYRIGNVGCHTHQALVLVNYGDAKGIEIWNLAQEIIKDIKHKFGIELQPEVNIWT